MADVNNNNKNEHILTQTTRHDTLFGSLTPLSLAEVLVIMPLLLGTQNAEAEGRPGGACACACACGACY